MMSWRLVLLLAIVGLALPSLSEAQGLGDVAAKARQEREQRSTEPKEPVRSFSNDDLPEREESDDDDEYDSGEDRSSDRGSSSGGSEALSAREREEELARARTRVQRLEGKVEELEQKLNPMSTTYIYGGTGGPVGGSQADEEIAIRRQLDATRDQLEDAREDVEDFEQSSRGSGRARPEPARDRDEEADY
jgi:hypothetical protein